MADFESLLAIIQRLEARMNLNQQGDDGKARSQVECPYREHGGLFRTVEGLGFGR
jgi:hypothetical protein